METSLILGLVGGLGVAAFCALVAYWSSEDELEYEEGTEAPAGRERSAKRGFFGALGFGEKAKTATMVGRRSEKAAGWRRDVEEACEATGLIKPAAVSWIAPLIIEGLKRANTDHSIAAKICGWGHPLDDEAKAQLGVRQDAKLGEEYIASLTKQGRRRPLAAAFFVVQRATHAHSQAERLRALQADESVFEIEVVASGGASSCAAAQQLEGKAFDPSKAPSLPLKRCDAETCNCVFQAVAE